MDNGEEVIKTDLGDQFVLRYISYSPPGDTTDITVLDITGKNTIISYSTPDYSTYVTPEVATVINSSKLIYYEFVSYHLNGTSMEECLVYQEKDSNFKGIEIYDISSEYITWDNTKEFIPISKILVSNNEWKWVKICGSLLVASGDEQMKQNLERYTNNNFTQDELEINKNSSITRDDMVTFARQTLEKTSRGKSS